MRLLFCCEFYFPSVGGVQEVMRQLAERMVQRGHEVTVATTRLADRTFNEYNGVKIAEFGVTGNLARGIEGEIGRYQEFVISFPCDAVMIKAAQQWTFDALWPVLDQINRRKVFIPCGFSGLYEPTYGQYFNDLPAILKKFDHLIFYAERYRDIDFARQHGLTHFSVLANGASEVEFDVPRDADFRFRHGIPESSFVLLTVGSLTGVKGHREIAEAFAKMESGGQHVTLILNGNAPPVPLVKCGSQPVSPAPAPRPIIKAARLVRWLSSKVVRVAGLAYRSGRVLRREGFSGVWQRLAALTVGVLTPLGILNFAPDMPWLLPKSTRPLQYWIERATRQSTVKRVLVTDFPRPELVQAYMAADLFVFASNIEYSPLVLFEAAAAGTPFLSVPVGNAEEIARWTGGGIICPAPKDERGYTRVDPSELAKALVDAMQNQGTLKECGRTARKTWSERYTWAAIAERYERILKNVELN